MIQAYILIQTEVGKAQSVAEAAAAIPGVISAEDVTGPYDVIVRAEAETMDRLGRLVVAQVQEVPGITGLAHMFEHMAFKGTDKIGTTDYAAEKAALEKVEKAYLAYDQARRRPRPDEKDVADKEQAWKDAIEDAQRYVVKEEFSDILEREGGQGLNASTSSDETSYYYSLPANRLELWAYLEYERFRKPVFLPSTVALTVDRRGREVVAGLTSVRGDVEHLVLTWAPQE